MAKSTALCPDCKHAASYHRKTKGCVLYLGDYGNYDRAKVCGCKRTPDEVRNRQPKPPRLTHAQMAWVVTVLKDDLHRFRAAGETEWAAKTEDALTALGVPVG